MKSDSDLPHSAFCYPTKYSCKNGAEETLLPLAQRYLLPVKFAVPSFLLTQLMGLFCVTTVIYSYYSVYQVHLIQKS
ncbi:MAG: hypothetical protein ACI4HN_06875 [Ruminococcus sp.]